MPLVSSREVTSPCINAHSRNNQRRPQSLCFKRIVSYCFSSFSYWVSGFWDVDCLATHRATVQYPYQTHRMPFPPGTASPNTEWHLVQYPAVPGPYRHQERLRAYGGGYRRALKVLGFARLVLGQSLHGDVEAGEACEAAEDEEGEEEVVYGSSEADSERGGRGCHAERYLQGKVSPLNRSRRRMLESSVGAPGLQVSLVPAPSAMTFFSTWQLCRP